MTTNKPEVVSIYNTATGESEEVIRLTDYEALQDECEELRKDAERYRWLRDGASMPTDLNPWEDVGFVGAVFVCTEYGSQTAQTDEDLDAAIDAAMQETSHDS